MRRLVEIWHKLGRLQRGLLLFFAANAIALNLFLAALPWTRNRITAVHHTAAFMLGHTSDDSWGPMGAAFEEFRRDPGSPLYSKIFFDRSIKFLYPPSSLLSFWVLDRLGLDGAARDLTLATLSWLAVILTAALVASLALRSIRSEIGDAGLADAWNRWVTVLLALGFTLTFYPVIRAFTLGQIQTWLTCLCVALIVAWQRQALTCAGVLAGLITLVKPQFALVGCWAAVRGQWRMVAGMGSTLLLGTLAAIAIFGWSSYAEYPSVLAYIAMHGESYFANQSINGLLHRLLADTSRLDFEHQFGAYNPWVYFGTVLSSAGLVTLALFWRPNEGRAARSTDLLIIILTQAMAAPTVWEHHYGPLIATFAVILPKVLRWPVLSRTTLPCLIGSYVLLSNLFRVTDLSAPTWFNFVQSYQLFGALMVLLVLYRVRHVEAARPAS